MVAKIDSDHSSRYQGFSKPTVALPVRDFMLAAIDRLRTFGELLLGRR
jgi:hypothetical protein